MRVDKHNRFFTKSHHIGVHRLKFRRTNFVVKLIVRNHDSMPELTFQHPIIFCLSVHCMRVPLIFSGQGVFACRVRTMPSCEVNLTGQRRAASHETSVPFRTNESPTSRRFPAIRRYSRRWKTRSGHLILFVRCPFSRHSGPSIGKPSFARTDSGL